MILFVRYRNHFPVVQFQNQAHIWNPYDPAVDFKTMGAVGAPLSVVRFQNQAHIWNPHGTGHVFKTIWGAKGAQRWRLGRHAPGGRGKSRRRREFASLSYGYNA